MPRSSWIIRAAAGIRQISLSVERQNCAHELYIQKGYRIVDSSDRNCGTMIIDIGGIA